MIDKLNFIHFLTATLVIETFMLFLFRFTKSPLTGKAINRWYDNLGWTAIILDILSVLIGFYLAKYFYKYLVNHNFITKQNEFIKFIIILILIQVFHDFTFYFTIIKNTNKGVNKVIDEFKYYAESVKTGAVIGDSIMYLIATPILYYYISKQKYDANVFTNIICFYLIGYFLNQKSLKV
jgi:hypothetical protein